MARSVRGGTVSPPLTSTGSYTTPTSGQKLNVISRLAIEGKVKQGSENASVKLYMKISASADSVSPGQIIPLFAEENVKIRDYQVHPLDSNSVPYVFSSTTNPLLHNAARALHLPERSTNSYLSLFDSASQASTSRSSNANGSVIPPLEERYTGYFLIRGYTVCFVLPKEFPPNFRPRGGSTDSDGDGLVNQIGTKPYKSRRSSISNRQTIQFMAGLDMSVPLASKPPKAPFMLTIPIPRCLSNSVKFRLPAPTPMSTSFASLSSEEDSPGWVLATEPHVSRTATSKNRSRSNAYNDFADDESSEGSLSHYSAHADNCIVQGTFTSADHLQIRWASPLSMQDFPPHGDGRRRARVSDVRAQLTCTVLEQIPQEGENGVRMRLDYQGTCTGIWFPGVATFLGMDVVLDTHGCLAMWPSDDGRQWLVDGDPQEALTGYSAGSPEKNLSRQDSLEIPQMSLRASPELGGSRTSSGSSASLLRQQLPRQISTDVSFEDSNTPPTSAIPSSIPSLATSMIQSSINYAASPVDESPLPGTPITLHLNMNELQPNGKNKFTFNVSGTLIISRTPGMVDSMDNSGWDTIPIPIFRVPSADNESMSTILRNQCGGATVEILGSQARSTQGRSNKTVVPSGSQARCGTGGSEILVKPTVKEESDDQLTPSLLRTRRVASGSVSQSMPASPRGAGALDPARRSLPFREGPLIIPWVTTEVVPLPTETDRGWKYAVTLSMPTPVDGPSELLEFGLALPKGLDLFATVSRTNVPALEVACASVNGVPVRFEMYGHLKPEDLDVSAVDPLATIKGDGSFEKRTWLAWIRVYTCFPGALEVVYTLEGKQIDDRKGKRKASSVKAADVPILIPLFSIPIGKLSTTIQSPAAFSNFGDPGTRLFDEKKSYAFDVKPFSDMSTTLSHPSLTQKVKQSRISRLARGAMSVLMALLPWILFVLLLGQVINMRLELQEMRTGVIGNKSASAEASEVEMKTVTITVNAVQTTPSPTNSGRRWLGETFTLSYTKSSQSPSTKVLDEAPPSAQGTPSLRVDPPDPEPTYEPEPEPDSGSSGHESEANRDGFSSETTSLISYIYLPISWLHFHYQNVAYEQLKQDVLSGWGRFWRVLKVMYHWPLPPDVDT